MMKIKIILAILVGIIELSAAQADNTEKSNTENVSQDTQKESACLAPYGIKLGQTTIEEVKKKFSLLRTEEEKIGDVSFIDYYLDPIDFNVGNLTAIKAIVATIGKSNIVEYVVVIFKGKCYADLKRILAKKYQVIKSEEPFVGDYYCLLRGKDQSIEIIQDHLDFDTLLRYTTKNIREIVTNAKETERRKDTAAMEDKL